MKRKIQKIGSAILCMALLGNAIAGSIPNGQVQAAQEYKEVYSDNFEDGKTYDTRTGQMTSSNVVEVKTNHYLKYTVTGLASVQSAPVPVVGGRQYQLTYRVNVPVANGNVHYWPIYQEWNEATDQWSNAISSTSQSCEITTTTDGWVEHSLNFTPSTGMDHVHFFFEQSWDGYAEIWLDDIVIRDTESQEVVYSEDFNTTQSFGVHDKNPTLTQSWETEELHDYALELEGASNGYAVKTSGIPVESGAEYKLTYKLRVSNVTGSIHFWPMYQEWKTDAVGAESGWTGLITKNTPTECAWEKATDGWIEQEMPITISLDNNNIQFFFEQAWSGTADIEMDDITFTKVSDGTVVFKQNFNTSTELTVHSSGSAGTQTFTEQGNHCLSLSGMGDVKTPAIRLENGKNYLLSYRAKVENVSGNIYFRPMYQEWYNDGVSIDDEYAGGTSPETYAVQAVTNGWVDIQMPFSFTGRRNMIQFFFEQCWSGTADIYIDDVKILEAPDTSRRVETAVSFQKVDVDNSWYFEADNLSEMKAQYYVATMKIDDEERRVGIENKGTYLVIWPNYFQDESLPTSQLEIPAGTELSEAKSDLTSVTGGEKVTITNTLKVVYVDDTWMDFAKVNTSKIETVLSIGSVNEGTWTLHADKLSEMKAQYYVTTMKVDGKESEVYVEHDPKDNYLTLWPNYFENGIPQSQLEIPAGTVLSQADPNAGWAIVKGGEKVTIIEDFKAVCKNNVWKEDKIETNVSFQKIESDDSWRFDADNLSEMTAKYYVTTMKIDGEDRRVYVENDGTQLVIWKGFFQGEKLPTSQLEIPAGTVLSQIDVDNNWSIVEGGEKVTIINDLKVVYKDNEWKEYKIETNVSFKEIESDNSWRFDADNLSKMTVQFYVTTIKIDGEDRRVGVENNGTQLVIWEGFFQDAKLPTSQLEIPAGTVLSQADPDASWAIVKGGEKVTITNALKVVYKNNVWQEYRLETNVSFKKVDVDNSWCFEADNNSEMTAKYYVTTMKIDGEDRRVSVENKKTQLVIWDTFFQDKKLPTSQLEIPAGTELSEADNNLTLVPDGEKVTITNTLKVVCIDNTWNAYDKETTSTRYVNLDAQKEGATISGTTQTTPGTYTEKYIQTETNTQVGTTAATIDSANTPVTFTSWQAVTAETWNFTMNESITFSDSEQYYKIPATVDGESTYVVIQFENGKKYGTIYAQPGWFGVYGSHIPEKSIKFAAGAVMKQVTPAGSWPEVEGGQVLQLTKDFELQFEKILVHRTSALYMTGDVHMDQEYNSMDLVAMKKVAANTSDKTTDLAALRATDVNGSDTVDATDLSALRGHLVGKFDIRYDSKINAAYSGVMPIIGYDAPDYDAASIDGDGREAKGYEVNFITDEIYAMVKDMGFNTVVANRNEIGGADNIAYDTLKLSEKYGLKAYIWNAYVSAPDNKDKVTTKEALDTLNQKYEKYNSFLGYYICDEPTKDAINNYATPFGLLQNYTNLSGYMNLYPYNTSKYDALGWMNESRYKEYLNTANGIGTDFLSYDMYLRDNSYNNKKEVFYKNLSLASTHAKDNDKPFYAFVQVGTDFEEDNKNSTAQSDLTTVQEMYLEANVSLAMGAKGLSYYSLIQPIKFANNSKGGYDLYRCGLINIEGKPNHGENGNANYDYYNAAKKINTYVAKIDEVLMNAEHKAVISTDKDVQKWVSKTTSYASLTSVTGADSVLVGCFEYYGREAYLVVSTSCDAGGFGQSQDVTLNFNTNASYSYVGMDCAEHRGSGTLNLSNLGSGESVLVVMD